jgi:hypothetical protein
MNELDALREAARILGKAGGSVKSERKAAAVRQNGKKGGRLPKRQYFFFSGEGEFGSWCSRYCTLTQARRFAEDLRAGGDRWASVWALDHVRDDWLVLYNIDTDDLREVPLRAIMYL